MLESSPAHCSTPGDAGKDLRREGLAESTSQAAYLALKVILVCFERQLGSQWYWLSLQVKEMALRKVGGLALWDFLDFIVRTRIPIFVLLRPFIQCKLLAQPAENHDELSARQHIADQLERRFIPRPLCKSSLIAEFNNELKILKEAVHSGSAYQGKTSISTVGTSTSAYRLSLATMSRSNTGTGTVWEQDSEPSQQASQDTLSRTDEEDEENDSISMPSVVSEQEAYLLSAIGRRRFSSHVSSMSAPQAEVGMLPSQRVASVQSEPGQQNLLVQQPLGRKRGLRQLRRPLLSRQKTQTEPRNRHAARLSTTRRSIQPKTKPSDQKRSVTFIEAQPEPAAAPTDALPATGQPQGCSPAPSRKPEKMDNPVLTSSPAIVVADLHSLSPKQTEATTSAEGERKEDTEAAQGATAHSPLTTQLSDPDDFTGLETSSLLQHGDTVLHISEENGMENPLLSSQFTFTPTELGETDVVLDESHV
ncbi:protein unc-80 homolog isoform X2 [Otolemur garnettii]|uniref:protein unc-80 homolog isoform X2 n=1 Tax=Otolemur garnettii TaxID=30611 RepID=UPI000C7F26EE|nr:protein unc-80 homolog isoform X2 [Otolemur garnettii]